MGRVEVTILKLVVAAARTWGEASLLELDELDELWVQLLNPAIAVATINRENVLGKGSGDPRICLGYSSSPASNSALLRLDNLKYFDHQRHNNFNREW